MRITGLGRAPRLAALAGAAMLAVAPAPAAAQGACADTTAAPGAASADQVESAVRCLVNATRAGQGLPALRASGRLDAAAARHSSDMVRRRYFEHVSPSGATLADRVRRTGYLSGAADWAVGEDIGWGTGPLASPESIVQAWMNSPPHRRVILSRRFREAGVGMTPGIPVDGVDQSGGGATFVLDVGMAR
jgi:uncharacterized protein YkwD